MYLAGVAAAQEAWNPPIAGGSLVSTLSFHLIRVQEATQVQRGRGGRGLRQLEAAHS